MDIPDDINPLLRQYVEDAVLPRYDVFDKGHQRDHAEYVIGEALKLSRHYDVDPDMVYAAAAFHDTGLSEDRKTHHIVSARIIREDKRLREWFTPEQIETIAEAAEDHRASSDHEPRTIYGKIIAEADRQIIPEVVIRRTIQYGLKNYPEKDKEGHWQRTVEHLEEKYAEGGYLKLWIPESSNAGRLKELRKTIRDKETLLNIFETVYKEELHEEILPKVRSLTKGEDEESCGSLVVDDIRKKVLESTEISEFQRKVYLELLNIPKGTTISYGELGKRIGCRSARAIGQALHRNPFAPDVPCHRVIKSDGSLGGYAFGIDRKAELLRDESSEKQDEGRRQDDAVAAPIVKSFLYP